MWISPDLTIRSDDVVLEPLSLAHCPDLEVAVKEGDIYRDFWTSTPSPEDMCRDIEDKLNRREAGDMIPFAIRCGRTNRIVGVTTFYSMQPQVPHLEIGYTWIAKSAQGTVINPAMKLLLLQYAFEVLGCEAVGIRTKWSNHQSRRAIEKAGFKLDGILRASVRLRNGALDDAVIYSMLRSEWPAAQSLLQRRIDGMNALKAPTSTKS